MTEDKPLRCPYCDVEMNEKHSEHHRVDCPHYPRIWDYCEKK